MTATDDRLERIEDKMDKLREQMSDYQLAVEHRVSVLEMKAGIWGTIGGLLSGAALYFGLKH